MEQNNFFDTFNESYQQQMAKPPKKKISVPGIVLLVIGVVTLLFGIGVLVLGNNISSLEAEEPVDVYLADETDQYVYTPVQYMTESVAYYSDMESMQFYIALDEEWNTVVVCIHDDDIEEYQPYIDWLYTDAEVGGPEQIEILGYAQPMDAELEALVLEGFVEIFGEGYLDSANFEEYFGEYYIQVGQKNGAYQFSNWGILFLVLGGILAIIGGAMLYHKSNQQDEFAGSSIVVYERNVVWGILGAFLGALLGGVIWAVVNILGYISGWIGVLIVFFAYTGYKILSKRNDNFGFIVSILLGIVMIFVATYVAWGWSYYQMINESVSGYTTFGRALVELPAFLESVDGWGDFVGQLFQGYGFMLVASFYLLWGNKRK